MMASRVSCKDGTRYDHLMSSIEVVLMQYVQNGTFAYSPPNACSPVDPVGHSCARGNDNNVGFYECASPYAKSALLAEDTHARPSSILLGILFLRAALNGDAHRAHGGRRHIHLPLVSGHATPCSLALAAGA